MDQYGQPISLNFEGSETYQTLPGGLITMLIILSLLLYSLTKGKEMILKTDWQLTQQTIVSDSLDMKTQKKLKEFSNVTLSLQFTESLKQPADFNYKDTLKDGKFEIKPI